MSITEYPHYSEYGEEIGPIIQWLVDHDETEAADNIRNLVAREREAAEVNEGMISIVRGWRERAEAAEASALHLDTLRKDAHAIVDRIWGIFGRPSYAELAGQTIYSLVADAKADAERYRYLKEACSSHYPMTHEQPAEWSIGWEFQQSRPDEAYGSFDSWIDRDITERTERQAKIDAEPEVIF